MKHALSSAMKMILAALFVFVAAPATAQTTANGPYYATPSWDQKLDCTAPRDRKSTRLNSSHG